MFSKVIKAYCLLHLLLLFRHSVLPYSLQPHGLQRVGHNWSDLLHTHTWTAAHQAFLSITNSRGSNSCPLSQWGHPTVSSSAALFSSCPQSFPVWWPFPISQLIRWPKYWSFSISPSNEYSGLIFFRIDLIFLQSKGISKVIQHHSSKTIIQHSAFFMVQPSHTYMTTRKTSFGCFFFAKPSFCWQNDVSAF